MPIELFFSNRIEQLAVDLAAHLYADPATASHPFAPVRLVVPNRNLAKWLQLTLARHLGVSMNIDYTYLDTALWDLLLSLNGLEPPPLPVDQDIYTLALLRVFDDLPPEAAVYNPIRGYLTPSSEPGGPAGSGSADTRRWQLAARLAHLFLEYELNRPEWMPAWRRGRIDGEGMAACQGRLYQRTLTVCDQLGAAIGRPVRSLPRLAGELLATGGTAPLRPPGGAPPVVTVFGLSQISTFHTALIERLKPWVRFRIFALNPSEAFWEEVRTPREKRWEAARGQDPAPQTEPFTLDEHPLLSLWGKPGRENIRRLCELGDYDFQAAFHPSARPASVLGRLQESLRLAVVGGEPALHQDTSLQVVGCPGRLREVETTHQRILHQLARDDGLQLTDIAVLVPDMTAYKPLFDAVFQRDPQQLRYNLVDTLAETESHFGRGALALLDLMAGRFSRAEVLGLMINPLFLARWSVDMDMVAVWAGWIEALNIYHGFDAKEKAAGGGAPTPRYTWQQGLRRLRLGRIMTTEGSPDGAFKGLLPYADLESGDHRLLERFCLAVEHLHSQVARLRRLAAQDPTWPRAFLDLCGDLLVIGPEAGGEAAVKQTLAAAFESLARFARLPQGKPPSGPLSIDLLRAFVAKHLRGLSTSHGDYLTGGVTLAALQPMRPIPFEIIYILGLEEGGGFPGRADNSSLDLRLANRRRGDVSTPERNHYLFLEALLSARRQVVISYVCRDLQKDRDLMPCAPVHQLKRFISDHLLVGGAAFNEQRVPLKGTDPAYLAEADPPPWADPLVNSHHLDRVLALRAGGAWPEAEPAVPERLREQVGAFAGARLAPAPRPTDAQGRLEPIFVDELRRFVLDPIPAKLRRHLGVRPARPPLENLLADSDEPFCATFPMDYLIVRATLDAWLDACWQDPGRPPAVEPLFERVYDTQALQGAVPEGVYERVDRRRLLHQVDDTAATLAPLVSELASAERRVRRLVVGHTTGDLRPQGEASAHIHHLPAVTLTAASGGGEEVPAVELSGALDRLWRDRSGGWHCLVLTGGLGRAPSQPNHHLIAPLLTDLAMRCTSLHDTAVPGLGQGAFHLHLATRGGLSEFRYRIDPSPAGQYLQELIRRYLDVEHHRWLPFRVITQGRLTVQKRLHGEIDMPRRQRFLEALVEAWDEAGDYLSQLARPRFDLDCLDEARRRVGIFFATEEA